MSIGRAIAEYIAKDPTILPDGEETIFPDVVNFVDQELERSAQFMDRKREGLAYGIVSDILAPRYGGNSRIASVVFDYANRMADTETKLQQEERFEHAFSRMLEILSILTVDMRSLTAFGKGGISYKVSSLQVTDSARILISAGFMRGYIVVDVGYTQE